MPYLIAQLDKAELAKIRSAGFEILAEGSFEAMREFFGTPERKKQAEKGYELIWLEGDPLETLGLSD